MTKQSRDFSRHLQAALLLLITALVGVAFIYFTPVVPYLPYYINEALHD